MKKIAALWLVLCLILSVGVALGEDADTKTSGAWEYVVQEDGTACITGWIGFLSSLIVPITLDGQPVTTIGEKAFANRRCLKSITIPDSVTVIRDGAFCRCPFLEQIIISPTHPSLELVDGVLFSKTDKKLICYPVTLSATSYTIPEGIVSIGDYAFIGCSSLIRITIPDCVTSVGKGAFAQCDSLNQIIVSPTHPSLALIDGVLFNKRDKELIWYPLTASIVSYSIPEGVMSIGDQAFESSSLTSISIPDSVTSIGYGAFSSSSLTSTVIPNSVISIGNSAFNCCTSLISISIPDSVTSIGNSAFAFCNSLTNIIIPDSVTSIGKDLFLSFEYPPSITVTPGSYAEQYAKDNGVPYAYPEADTSWLND